MHRQESPLPGATFVLEMNEMGVIERRPVPAVPQQGLIVRIVAQDEEHVTLQDIDSEQAKIGPIRLRRVDVSELGPAESIKVNWPDRWRGSWAGGLRVRVPWAAWWTHVSAELRRVERARFERKGH